MVEPIAKPRPAKETPTPIRDAPKESNTRKPTVGAQTQEGSAKAETGAKTNSIGLSTGGGGTGGQINVGNFCCPGYIAGMVSKVHQNWNSRQSSAGITTMQFTIQRDGSLTEIACCGRAAIRCSTSCRIVRCWPASVAAAAGGVYEPDVDR